jgi:hypothetical protein
MDERKVQREGRNSVSRQIEAFSDASRDIEVPAGVTLRSDEERTIWDQFTRARAKADWRAMDLVLLGKVVRIESEMRKYQQILDCEGIVVINAKGTQIVNPLVSVLDTMLRQQLALIRSMSLNTTIDPRSIDAAAREESKARKVLEEKGVRTLLAMP